MIMFLCALSFMRRISNPLMIDIYIYIYIYIEKEEFGAKKLLANCISHYGMYSTRGERVV
jgi:hypothetical protein